MEPANISAQHEGRWGVGPVVMRDRVYHLTRRADVVAALHNSDVFSRGGRRSLAFDMVAAPVPAVPSGFDPPELTRYRKILQPMFSPHAIEGLRPALSRQARASIDAAAGDGQSDEVATLYPIQALLTFCGLPVEDRDMLASWGTTIHALRARPTPAYSTASLKLFGYLAGALRKRRQDHPNPVGFLSQLVTSGLSDAEALGASALTVLGGTNTVTIAIRSVLLALATRPELCAVLRADPGQVRPFVDEILRLEPPAPSGITRVTTQDVTVGNVTIPAGSLVSLSLASANHEDGDVLSVTDGRIVRRPHWSFGAGAHRCLGSHLARMELTVLVNEWLKAAA